MSFQNKCENIDIYGAIGRQVPLRQGSHAMVAGGGEKSLAGFVSSAYFGIEQAEMQMVFGISL